MSKKQRSSFFESAAYVLIIGFGGFEIGAFVLYIFLDYSVINLSRQINFEIDPLQIISLVVTLFLTLYVVRVLDKKNDFRKTEIKLLTDYFSEFREEFRSVVKDFLEADKLSLVKVSRFFKASRSKMEVLSSIAIEQGFIDDDSSLTKDLKSEVNKVLNLLTDTKRENTENGEKVSVKEGEIILNELVSDSITEALDVVDKLVFKCVIELNRKE